MTTRDQQQMPQLRLRFQQRRDMEADHKLAFPEGAARQLNLAVHLAADVARAHTLTLPGDDMSAPEWPGGNPHSGETLGERSDFGYWVVVGDCDVVARRQPAHDRTAAPPGA